LLDETPAVLAAERRVAPGDLRAHVEGMQPDVVCIDSPPAWGVSGGSRRTERELRGFGIQSFGTPSDPKKADNAFYGWMKVGIAAFEAIADLYPRYCNGPVKGKALEVFPHASAVFLASYLPPRSIPKTMWRRSILQARGIDGLRSADQVDAALAALTGLMALRGRFTALGDPREGVIVVPSHTLPAQPFRRYLPPPVEDLQPHLPGLSPCACGDPDCRELTAGEFARGHDAKRKSALWGKVRDGFEAGEELKRRGWELPPEAY
jgi:predicted nuclease with RNAse H fold